MVKKLKYFIVGADRSFIKTLSNTLKPIAEAVSHSSSKKPLQKIIEFRPDCIIFDDDLKTDSDLIQSLRSIPVLKRMKIIASTETANPIKEIKNIDIDGHIRKPLDSEQLADRLINIVEDNMELIFWGVHGTLPTPGPETVNYGGNTSCVSLRFPKGNYFIFDAGSGIKVFSDDLMSKNEILYDAKIFISHPHWDHINALPFFMPLYIKGNDIEILGPAQGRITMFQLISGQMDGVYFPIKIKEFGADVSFRDLKEEEFTIGDVSIRTIRLSHPGYCLGYRIDYNKKSICYITDNELFPKSHKLYSAPYIDRLSDFILNADCLIMDTTYMDKDYEKKIGWGHSSVSPVVKLADLGKVKKLCLFHHDPDHTDHDIEIKLKTAQALAEKMGSSTKCTAPKEKQAVII